MLCALFCGEEVLQTVYLFGTELAHRVYLHGLFFSSYAVSIEPVCGIRIACDGPVIAAQQVRSRG
jgi:hypothetical protein